MYENVYSYLREYGFTKEEFNYFKDENEEIFFTNVEEITKNINFLINKGLNKEEVMNLIRKDPFMLTTKNNRLDALDKIYLEELKLNKEELKQLIINNPDTYIESPIEIQKIIDYLKKSKSIEEIKQIIINNPKFIDMTLEEFIKLYGTN